MAKHLVLEICVESVDCAIAAERGGADRIELCSNLYTGGVTPDAKSMKVARKSLRLPIHALIRPRPGDFVYSGTDLSTMETQISMAKDYGMDGIVLGVLDSQARVDVERTRRLVEFADPLPVTFHRAFDITPDLAQSLEHVVLTGARRVLTAGGKTEAERNINALAMLVRRSGDRIPMMPGGGITLRNVTRVIQRTGVSEIHTSLGKSSWRPGRERSLSSERLSSGVRTSGAFEKQVRGLVQLLARLDNHSTADAIGALQSCGSSELK
jgi:copper homeostasis protein